VQDHRQTQEVDEGAPDSEFNTGTPSGISALHRHLWAVLFV
jgi:hypothetical protein